jgi:hypothetical protein
MSRFIDFTGKRFGKLVVIRRADPPDHIRAKRTYWLCKCDCGNEKIIWGDSLRRETTKSCGCGKGRIVDLTGKKFGKLKVIKRGEKPKGVKNGSVYWWCECECGKKINVISSALQAGDTTSCSCSREKDLSGQRFGKLIVIERNKKINGNLSDKWLCKCDCGKETIVKQSNLHSGHTCSCGCLNEEKISDITGKKFGRLTAIREDPSSKKGKLKWVCQCECGKSVSVDGYSLRGGRTKSCGCYNDEKRKEQKIDLVGRKFGRLTVIKDVGRRVNKSPLWLCQCDCGGTKETTSKSLMGGTKSCGCLYREAMQRANGSKRKSSRKLDNDECCTRLVYRACKYGARSRKIDFNIDLDTVRQMIKKPCAYCGEVNCNKMKYKHKENYFFRYNGIDRIDSLKGYTKDNIVTCCGTCNQGKNDLTVDEFYKWIDRVHIHPTRVTS